MQTRWLTATLAAALCGGSLGQSGMDTPATRFGLVSVTRLSLNIPGMPGGLVTPSALFTRQALGGGSARASGSCQVFAGAPAAEGQETRADSLDAGDPITLRGQGGPFATLKRVTVGSSMVYQPQNAGLAAMTAALPAGATVNIPGAAGDHGFPAFKNAALPEVPTLSVTAPQDLSSFTPEQPVRWQGSTQGGVLVLTGVASSGQVYFVCTVTDNGSFTLPAATQAELQARGFESGQLSVLRSVSRVLRQGDAQLTLSVTDLVSGQMPGS